MVFRVHHCMADGVALVRMLVEVLADPGHRMLVVNNRASLGGWQPLLRALLYMPLQMLTVLVGRKDRSLLHPGPVADTRTADWQTPLPSQH